MNYYDENDELLKNLFEQTHFESWKQPRFHGIPGYSSIEIYTTSDCNLACKYCYLNRHQDKLYPPEIRRDNATILKNIRMIFEWLKKNNYTPGIEYYSGSSLESEVGLQTLEVLYEAYKDAPLEIRPPYVTVPTNYTWLMDEEYEKRVIEVLDKVKSLEIDLRFSASVDGPLMDTHNRPFRKESRLPEGHLVFLEDKRDEVFYQKVFEFNAKYDFGFHPMVYSNKIHLWKENFLWFQEMYKKFGFDFSSIYMLEVRNEEWSDIQIEQFVEFMEFLMDWTWEKLNQDKEAFLRFLTNKKGYNILVNTLFRTNRGTSCGLQQSLYVRAGDLKIIPCHRLSYDGYNFGQFIVEGGEIVDIKAENVDFAYTISSFDFRTQPVCQDCLLKESCMGGCTGAQLEYNGEPFIPILPVCKLMHAKTVAILKKLIEFDLYDSIKRHSPPNVAEGFDSLLALEEKVNG